AAQYVHRDPSQQDAADRCMAQALPWVKRRGPLDLLAKIRRGVQEQPVRPIRAHGDARLGSRKGSGSALARSPTPGRVGIPLGEAAAGSRPQDNNLHSGVRSIELTAVIGVDLRTQDRKIVV